MPDDEYVRALTKLYARRLEWVIPAAQSYLLLTSATLDPYKTGLRAVVTVLAGLHLALIPAYRKGYGPLAKGGWRVPLFFAVSLFGMPLVVFLLATPHTYGTRTTGVPLYGYAVGAWLVLMCFPWATAGYRAFAWTAGLLSFVVYPFYVLTLAGIAGSGIGWKNIAALVVSQPYLIVAFIAGRGLQDTFNVGAGELYRVREVGVEEYRSRLHSDMKNGILDIAHKLERMAASPEREQIEVSLRDLMRRTIELRIAYYLTLGEVQLGKLLDERMEIFESRLVIQKPSPIMAIVDENVAELIDRALSDLLTNAQSYGATTVTIEYEEHLGSARLSITDDGPGFPDDVLEDPRTSLYGLRQQFRSIGGDLTKGAGYEGVGTTIHLWRSLWLAGRP